jgi:hypothetical protein
MTIEEPKAMREIHEIRNRIYEETKNMTRREMMAYYKNLSDNFEKESGIKLPSFKKTLVK